MTESKPVSAEVLRKALDQRMNEATAERLEAKRPLQANYWLGYAEGLEKAQDLFSVFQADYDKQIHVSHKQPSEDWMPKCKNDDCINWEDSDCGYGLDWRMRRCKEYPKRLKELLEASGQLVSKETLLDMKAAGVSLYETGTAKK